jgi:hypothetical protein
MIFLAPITNYLVGRRLLALLKHLMVSFALAPRHKIVNTPFLSFLQLQHGFFSDIVVGTAIPGEASLE